MMFVPPCFVAFAIVGIAGLVTSATLTYWILSFEMFKYKLPRPAARLVAIAAVAINCFVWLLYLVATSKYTWVIASSHGLFNGMHIHYTYNKFFNRSANGPS